jgi:hypothetical protein
VSEAAPSGPTIDETLGYINQRWEKPRLPKWGPLFEECTISIFGLDEVRFRCSLKGYRQGDLARGLAVEVVDVGDFYGVTCDLANQHLYAAAGQDKVSIGCSPRPFVWGDSAFRVDMNGCDDAPRNAGNSAVASSMSCNSVRLTLGSDTGLGDRVVNLTTFDSETAIRVARAVNHLDLLMQRDIAEGRKQASDPFAR